MTKEDPPRLPQVARTLVGLRSRIAAWRQDGLSVGLVPTMGALHQGHLSLIHQMIAEADRVIVSIFVNPSQFGPGEDFDSYPRDEIDDLEKIGAADAHLAYFPDTEDMYGDGFATTVAVAGLTDIMCGAARPGHFDGVATVVAKLLLQCLPDAAIFGEKDFQQLQVIRRLVADLDIPVRILAGATVREPDGLALSSRNAYLTETQRRQAALLPHTLGALCQQARDDAACAERLRELEKEGVAILTEGGFASVDYLEFRYADGLALADDLEHPVRLLVAARIGKTRLIDNLPVK